MSPACHNTDNSSHRGFTKSQPISPTQSQSLPPPPHTLSSTLRGDESHLEPLRSPRFIPPGCTADAAARSGYGFPETLSLKHPNKAPQRHQKARQQNLGITFPCLTQGKLLSSERESLQTYSGSAHSISAITACIVRAPGPLSVGTHGTHSSRIAKRVPRIIPSS